MSLNHDGINPSALQIQTSQYRAKVEGQKLHLKQILKDGDVVWGVHKINECRARLWELDWVLREVLQ